MGAAVTVAVGVSAGLAVSAQAGDSPAGFNFGTDSSYVSVLGPEERWISSLQALHSARGFVWSWLRRHLDLRVTPELDFRPDRSMEHAAHIQSLLAGLRSAPPGGGSEP